jgi:hypothetical protein
MFRWLAEHPEKAGDCGIIVPRLGVLGPSERMIRAVLAAYRELGVTIYSADTGGIISWIEPAQTLLKLERGGVLELDRELLPLTHNN